MKITNKLFVFFAIIFYGISFSQVTLKGKIISTKTKLPPNENLMIVLENSYKGVFSDSLGNFTLENLEFNKTYKIKSSSIELGNILFELKTTNDTIIHKTFELLSNCKFNSQSAIEDWENNNAKLLLIGSIAPVANSKTDKKFEKRYFIKYYDFGCTPEALECIIEYNTTILDLMTIRYGKKWKSKMRKDVIIN